MRQVAAEQNKSVPVWENRVVWQNREVWENRVVWDGKLQQKRTGHTEQRRVKVPSDGRAGCCTHWDPF